MVLNRLENIKRQAEAIIPTPFGELNMVAYSTNIGEKMPHIAMVHPDMNPLEGPVLVRFHSECITGDLFGSKRCDCGEQLDKALEMISEHKGIVVYLRQEGRGIGIINKLKAYQLQDTGLNTIDANLHLGLDVDSRDYTVAIDILKDLGVESVRLMTNNPLKLKAFEDSDIEAVGREPIIIEAKKENLGYLETKRDLMGHMLQR
ncbi:MAG: GTP cyclohydrolase II [Saprospiraceae bacterium]|nr:GTP cyclohydrolase II [Saprospiraceae bacterium]